ncbi:MAG: O-antigen ligase family protein [Saprospiraceae bacterium]|nr:O-antigen ligase family protein [Saprospiraceae bacterium]MBP7699398.1 O-antigen ligase family protein [Saprospiraceae bacterium]
MNYYSRIITYISTLESKKLLFGIFASSILLCIFAGIATAQYAIIGLPIALVVVYFSVVDFRKVYFLLICMLPFSIETEIGSFGTDLPTEPLMWLLMGVYMLHVLQRGVHIRVAVLLHPITLLLLSHIGWIIVAAITSSNPFVSFKFLIAKSWYIVVFYFLTAHIIKTWQDVRTLFWCVAIPLLITIMITMVRHASYDFSFSDINRACWPYFRNHVSYAAMMAALFPYFWLNTFKQRRWSRQWWCMIAVLLLLLVAIQLSYTRAAYAALLIAGGAYFVIKYRATRLVLAGVLVGAIVGTGYLYHKNNYLDFAPDYTKTVTQENFNDLLSATAKGEDISTMERIYRWVAGSQMIKAKPFMGFGPGNFYDYYKAYTVSNFKTYVSDNPEHSGIHCYYLMTFVEQGIIGLIIFVCFCFYVLIRGERIYHATTDPQRKSIVMTVLLSSIIIFCILLINDMLETDKIGSFFLINIAILFNMDLGNNKQSRLSKV